MKKSLSWAKIAATAALEKKATSIIVINVSRFTIISEYFVIATVGSHAQRKSVLEQIGREMFKKHQVQPLHSEGRGESGWSIIDYGSVIVHIFLPETREMFALEKLYHGARKLSSFA